MPNTIVRPQSTKSTEEEDVFKSRGSDITMTLRSYENITLIVLISLIYFSIDSFLQTKSNNYVVNGLCANFV